MSTRSLAMDDKPCPVAVIGASYAASWPIRQLSTHPVINVGVDGNETSEMLARFDNDVLKADSCKVLIWGFINDIFRTDFDSMAAAKTRIRDNISSMVEMAEGNNVEVYLATEVTIREASGFGNWIANIMGRALGKKSYQDSINEQVVEVNSWLKEYGDSKGMLVFDFESLLADSTGKRKKQFAVDDGSHLSDSAYDAMSTYTEQQLINERQSTER